MFCAGKYCIAITWEAKLGNFFRYGCTECDRRRVSRGYVGCIAQWRWCWLVCTASFRKRLMLFSLGEKLSMEVLDLFWMEVT